MNEGWGRPRASLKNHFFVDQVSLCSRWYFGGPLEGDAKAASEPDDCAVCATHLSKRVPKR